METIYIINEPYEGGKIIVIGDVNNGYYEYRLVDKKNDILFESKECYGLPEVALRDALIKITKD